MPVRRFLGAVDAYLPLWILLAALAGFAFPSLAGLTAYSTPILAAMVGSVSLTLSVTSFARLDARSFLPMLVGHLLMPVLGYAVAVALGLSNALVVGFVLVGAVTPEIVTPVMVSLADGDTALAASGLLGLGGVSLVVVPVAVTAVSGAGVSPTPLAVGLLTAVLLPMVAGVALRSRFPDRVRRYDDVLPAFASLLVVVIIAGVAGANAGLVRASLGLVAVIAGGAVALNAAGYALGYALSAEFDSSTRVAVTLSVGMRDFAVAAALAVAAGLPAAVSLPAVLFGVVELVSSSWLATRWQ